MPVRKVLEAYCRYLEAHPYKTQILTGVFMFGFGDAVCQKYIERRADLDIPRMLRFSFFGALYNPAATHWYWYLQHICSRPFLSKMSLFKQAIAQTTLDQTFFACGSYIVFYYIMGLMEEGSIRSGTEKVKEKLWVTLCANWVVWPIAQFFNFRYVPLLMRVLYDNFINLWYNVCWSYIAFSL